ncbi:sigma-70 family RNA polymerase sigma factor [Paenibacillus glucanolyticus]|uniref:sigma-70 family RNA polymerase sigma factor n=1 Tax=Paenibacillus glucanolyticus TaxID=59843 RepID=UPI0035E33A99
MNIGYNPHLGYEDEVLQGYKQMVHSVANKFRVSISAGIEYADLVSIGTMGLITAFRNYDPDRFDGRVTSFGTYAYPMIKWEIQRYLRDRRNLIRVPRSIQRIMTSIRKQGWMEESADFIAEKGGWNLSEVQEAQKHINGWSIASLDRAVMSSGESDEEKSILDLLPSTSDFTGVYVQEFASLLEPRERSVLELRLQDRTQGQIAQAIGRTQVQVSRIIKQIGNKFIQFQDGTLKREGAQMSRGKGNQTLIGANIEWFVDEVVSTTPTIGLNTSGLHLNTRAVHEIGCKAGQCLQVGFDPEGTRLVVQVANKGLKLRSSSGDKSGGLRLVNTRLSAWLKEKQVTPKRYALRADPSTELFYIELERHA